MSDKEGLLKKLDAPEFKAILFLTAASPKGLVKQFQGLEISDVTQNSIRVRNLEQIYRFLSISSLKGDADKGVSANYEKIREVVFNLIPTGESLVDARQE